MLAAGTRRRRARLVRAAPSAAPPVAQGALLSGEMDDELRREWLRAQPDSFAPIEA